MISSGIGDLQGRLILLQPKSQIAMLLRLKQDEARVHRRERDRRMKGFRRATDESKCCVVQPMTESARPRDAEQPSDDTSSVAGPPAGVTALWGSLIPASGSSGCSTGGVAPRPTTPARQSHWRVKKVALENTEVVSKRSALETTDALPKNFVLGGNGLIFSLDRLFHRRFALSRQPRQDRVSVSSGSSAWR